MADSRDISERFWNLSTKADEECERETTFIDDIIQKAHIERELLSGLDGIKTAFDGGAGYGRFSILLAKRGVHVTHFNISKVMLDKAKEIRLAGPGALSRSIPREVLINIMRDDALKRDFLDCCYWYDSQPWCAGLGKDNIVANCMCRDKLL